MKPVQVTDDWLSFHMQSLGDKCLQTLPKEEEIAYEYTEKFQQKMKVLLKRAELKERYKIPVTAWGRTAASIAVVMIGIFMASLSVEAIRTEIYEFIQQRFETFTRTEYQIIKNESVEFVPLYPQYIPEGYEMDVCDIDEGYLFLSYIDSTKQGFSIQQVQITDAMGIYEDNEYVVQEKVKVKEHEAVLSKKENKAIHVRWTTDSCYYQVAATGLSEQEVLKICNSLEE